MTRFLASLSRESRLFLGIASLVLLILLAASGAMVAKAAVLHGELARAEAVMHAAAEARKSGLTVADAEAAFIHATSDGLAAANLEKRLSDILAQAGLMQRSMEVLPASGPDRGPLVLSIDLTGDTGKLKRALYQIETGEPLIFVKELDLENNHAGEPVSAEAAVDLAIHLVVEAYARLERRP